MKGQVESFHLNGHIIGFGPQTQKLESPYNTPSSTLAVKGLIKYLITSITWNLKQSKALGQYLLNQSRLY